MTDMGDILYLVGEAFSAHNLLRYFKTDTSDIRVRMVTGGAMLSLGYTLGPGIEERFRQLKDPVVGKVVQRELLYTAGGAALGALLGYHLGPRVQQQYPALPDKLEQILQAETKEPSGLIAVLSAGFLGYSLLLNGKTPQEKRQHYWGLGAGLVGYGFGPALIRRVAKLELPPKTAQDALRIYTIGCGAVGAAGGALAGWYHGRPEGGVCPG